MYPHLNTYQKLLKKMQDPAFLYSSIKICDVCYENLKEVDNEQSMMQTEYLNLLE